MLITSYKKLLNIMKSLSLLQLCKKYQKFVFFLILQYADWVLDNIDKNKNIKYRLYRHHATTDGLSFIKVDRNQ